MVRDENGNFSRFPADPQHKVLSVSVKESPYFWGNATDRGQVCIVQGPLNVLAMPSIGVTSSILGIPEGGNWRQFFGAWVEKLGQERGEKFHLLEPGVSEADADFIRTELSRRGLGYSTQAMHVKSSIGEYLQQVRGRMLKLVSI